MVALGIADDEPDILKLLKLVLEKKGYPIAYQAGNGDEAVELHRQNPTEIVIMDYRMPLKNGVEAAKEIFKEFPGTRFFLMTCGEDVSGLLDGLDGMVTIIKKPFMFKSMIKLLERSTRT